MGRNVWDVWRAGRPRPYDGWSFVLFFYCTFFAYLLQYLLMLAIHEVRGLRRGCCLIKLGAPQVRRTPATLSTAIAIV